MPHSDWPSAPLCSTTPLTRDSPSSMVGITPQSLTSVMLSGSYRNGVVMCCSPGCVCVYVGASSLAMVVNDYAPYQIPSGALGFFASELAPTVVVALL